MAYQVLARKWRPRSFPEMVGQAHVLRVLINALDSQRLHHAYLFTGTRGVGKTTVARIFAKSLNCETGVGSRPCGECTACREIDGGRFVDLIEVDAASRTKVEDTRDLLENVQYAPTRGRYKVYLIDEVHMLSTSSFNALLKTLEEPPPHVKFLLATTDPQKLPATILSRCLQFSLKHLPPEQIGPHLAHVLEQENIAYDPPALRLLARAAHGSMRDALSLLDQAIAFGGGRVAAEETAAMLGALEQGAALDLLRALADGDAPAVLARVARLAEHNPDYPGLLGDLLGLLQRLAVAQLLPHTLDPAQEEDAALAELAQRVVPEDVQLFYQIGLTGRRDLPLAPDPRGGFEMLMLRMLVFRPAVDEARGLPAAQAAAPARSAAPPRPAPPAAPMAPDEIKSAPRAEPGDDWAEMVRHLKIGGLIKVLAENCALQSRDAQGLHLLLPIGHASLNSPERQARLQQALADYLGRAVTLRISVGENQGQAVTPAAQQERAQLSRQQAAVEEIENDPVVQEMQRTFDARLDRNSIRPLDEE